MRIMMKTAISMLFGALVGYASVLAVIKIQGDICKPDYLAWRAIRIEIQSANERLSEISASIWK